MLRRVLKDKTFKIVLIHIFLVIGLFVLQGNTVYAEYAGGKCIPPRVLIMEYDTGNNLIELAINETIELNREDVNFVNLTDSDKQSPELMGNEYELTVEANQEDAGIAIIKMTLIDPKERGVHQVKVEESMDGWDVVDLEKHLSQAAAQQMTPMLEIIREHQRKIREEENSAINARVECEENVFTVGVNQELTVEFKLVDCDNYILSERPIIIEHEGVGTVTPLELKTDENGLGYVLFKSETSGNAEIEILYRYENTDGMLLQAEELVKINVQDHVMGRHALVEGEMSMDGVVSKGRMFSCNGIGGLWKFDWELIFSLPEVQGTLSGNGSFTFSDDPQPGDRTPISLDMTGTLVMHGATADYNGVYEFDIVLLEESQQLLIRNEAGTLTGQIVVTTPNESVTVPFSFPVEQSEAVPIQFVSFLPECD
ncbi:MAG: hypothetical protein ACLFUI_01640 [Halanaerobiales bacterium]